MSTDKSYNIAKAKEATQKLIINISKFMCENKLIADSLRYHLDKCEYDNGIVIDIDDALFKLGLSLADLLRYWDDEDDEEQK